MVGLAAGVHIYAANVPGIETGECKCRKRRLLDLSGPEEKSLFIYLTRAAGNGTRDHCIFTLDILRNVLNLANYPVERLLLIN